MFNIILFLFSFLLITTTYAQLPDLTVGNVSGPSTGNINQQISVNVTVNRTGGQLTNGTYVLVRVYLSTDNNITESDLQIGESTSSQFLNSTLNSNGTSSGTITCTLPGNAVTYYLGAIADPPSINYHPESNENNNSRAGNTIQIGRLTITSPNGGQIWTKGSAYNIQWTSQNITGNVDIDIYKGGSPYDRIANGIPNSHTFSWTPPISWPDGSDYQAAISGMGGNVWDFGDNNFTLQAPPLPDLTVGSVGGPSTGNINQQISVDVTVNRTGGQLTSGPYVLVRVYLSTDNNITESDLQIGESTTSQFLSSTLNTTGTAS